MIEHVPVRDLVPGDLIELAKCEPVVVDEIRFLEDGRVWVLWSRGGDRSRREQRRHVWKRRRGSDGRRIRLSFGALQLINEAVDGCEYGSLAARELTNSSP